MTLYDTIGHWYSAIRKPDPRIAKAIDAALGDASSIANIGAGSGSYEPLDRSVTAVEPSEVMIRQRPAGSARCLQGSADAIPLDNASVDAALAILTIHHWPDIDRGFCEMARVARKRIVILTWVPDAPSFWLTRDYFPQIMAHDLTIFPCSADLALKLQQAAGTRARSAVTVTPLPVPHDCTDGFLCAYWRRPECYLEPERRAAISSFARIDASDGLVSLRQDLASGRWLERNGWLMPLDSLDLGYRIVVCEFHSDT